MEELVGIKQTLAIVFSKLLPLFQYKLCTSYGITKWTYSSSIDILGGSGKGNVIPGIIYRDKLYFIFMYIEKMNIGFRIITIITKNIITRLAISLVYNTIFFTIGFII